jgi:hypothetical protein
LNNFESLFLREEHEFFKKAKMSQDEVEILSESGEELEAEKLSPSEEEELEEKRAADEEEFDPTKPADLTTEADKRVESEDEQEAGAEDINSENCESESGDSDESDDSIVCDEIESACPDHKKCVAYAAEVDAFLLRTLLSATGKKERQAALAEVLCDHYKAQ